eukprot:14139696-Alexandrium_andersonii.AAC.1
MKEVYGFLRGIARLPSVGLCGAPGGHASPRRLSCCRHASGPMPGVGGGLGGAPNGRCTLHPSRRGGCARPDHSRRRRGHQGCLLWP